VSSVEPIPQPDNPPNTNILNVNLRLQPHDPPETNILNREPLPKCLLKAGSSLFRVHTCEKDYSSIHYSIDKPKANRYARFNDPRREYGVLYAALDAQISLRETVSFSSFSFILREYLDNYRLSEISILRDLILIDISGSGLAQINADSRITAVTNEKYQLSQAWSEAFYNHPDRVDGIYYRSRHDPSGFCVALFEGRIAKKYLREQRVTENNLLDSSFARNLQRFLDQYGYERDDTDNP
jgi:hypothetical protein